MTPKASQRERRCCSDGTEDRTRCPRGPLGAADIGVAGRNGPDDPDFTRQRRIRFLMTLSAGSPGAVEACGSGMWIAAAKHGDSIPPPVVECNRCLVLQRWKRWFHLSRRLSGLFPILPDGRPPGSWRLARDRFLRTRGQIRWAANDLRKRHQVGSKIRL